jgi:FtsP/CotA-like multicopper oxidase with cupredoxin domain
MPPGLDVPLQKIGEGETQATMQLSTEKMAPGTYCFIINGAAQVPFEATPGNKQNIRCVYPSNMITLELKAKEQPK